MPVPYEIRKRVRGERYIGVYIPKEWHAALKEKAKRLDTSVSELLRLAVAPMVDTENEAA